jgi:hypothetical protein
MADDIPDRGLSHDWLIVIGALIIQWSVFDAVLTSHMRNLLAQPRATHLRPKHLRIPFTRRLGLYRKLAPLFYSGAALKSASLAVKIAEAIKDDRNWLSHGMPIREPDGALSIFRTDDLQTGDVIELDQRFSRDRLVAAARAMDEARICLIRAYASVAGTLAPPPFV